jgi:hypothetical protein
MKGIGIKCYKVIFIVVALTILTGVMSCGMKLEEESANYVMENIFKARKSGSFYKEFSFYAKTEFKIVPFDDIESTLRTVVGGAGRFKKAKYLSTKKSRRNQIGEGLIAYMVLSYEVSYTHATIIESYYFLGDSETPKLVYMTLQF